jgi:iron complex outermembrane receptor protein
MWGFYLQDGWRVTDKFLLTPGIRYDIYETSQSSLGEAVSLEDDDVSLSLMGTYSLTPKDTLTASVYRKIITPSAPDAFWWYEGIDSGLYSTALKLEKNNAAELAYQHNFSPRNSIRLSGYYYSINDFIKRFTLTDGTGRRGCYNIDKVKLMGGSLEGSAEILTWLAVRGNVTYQKSKKEGDSQDTANISDELDYLPEWKGNLGVDIKLPYGAAFSVRERVVGIRKAVYSGKLVKLSPFATTDIELKVPVTKHGEIGIFVENLFDENYEEQFGYALPGMIIGASAKITF